MTGDIFLRLDGIDGESADRAHAGEIEVLAWSWGVARSGSAFETGGAGTAKAGFHDLAITKRVDLASPVLWHHCLQGRVIAGGTLTVRGAAEDPVERLVLGLRGISVGSVSAGGGDGEGTTERVSLNFAGFEMRYAGRTDGGGAGTAKTFGWDIRANKGGVR